MNQPFKPQVLLSFYIVSINLYQPQTAINLFVKSINISDINYCRNYTIFYTDLLLVIVFFAWAVVYHYDTFWHSSNLSLSKKQRYETKRVYDQIC